MSDDLLMWSARDNQEAEMCERAYWRGKQEGERLGLERAADYVDRLFSDPAWRQSFVLLGPRCVAGLGSNIRALASTPSADWVIVERSKLEEAYDRLGYPNSTNVDAVLAMLEALLKK